MAKHTRPKNQARFRGFARPRAPDRHRERNLSRSAFGVKKNCINKFISKGDFRGILVEGNIIPIFKKITHVLKLTTGLLIY